jgi:3-hydroxyisobutyrate dehydrogenase
MKIAFLGTGLMGGRMAKRLLDNDYKLIVWNRTGSKTDLLRDSGATVAVTPSEAIKESDLVITMLTDFTALQKVLLEEKQLFNGKTIIQMSTISPGESKLLKDRVENWGGEYIEAPVLGGLTQIPEGKLLLMVGSSVEQFSKWKTFLANFGTTIIHMGEVGKGAAAKLACNQLIASLITSFAMSLAYVRENNLDVEKFMSIIRPSNYYAPAFDRKLNNMINLDFSDTNFPLKHLFKDVNLILNEFSSKNISTSLLEAVKQILNEGIEKNMAEKDYSALYNIVHPIKRGIDGST